MCHIPPVAPNPLPPIYCDPQASAEGELEKEELQSEDTGGHSKKTAVVGATEPTAAAAVNGDGAVRWYERAYDYWEDGENCPPNDDGVLGGYGHISPTDIVGSGAFLDELQGMRPHLGNTHAAGGWRSLVLGTRQGSRAGPNGRLPLARLVFPLLQLCLISEENSVSREGMSAVT